MSDKKRRKSSLTRKETKTVNEWINDVLENVPREVRRSIHEHVGDHSEKVQGLKDQYTQARIDSMSSASLKEVKRYEKLADKLFKEYKEALRIHLALSEEEMTREQRRMQESHNNYKNTVKGIKEDYVKQGI